MGQTAGVDLDDARRILGVEADADDGALRRAHRHAIRRAHPDAGGSAAAAADVNEAWDVLRHHEPGAQPPPPAPASGRADPAASPAETTRPADVDEYYRVEVEPDELLARLAEAGHEVGEVIFVDPHVGMLEIVVGEAPAVGQLAVTVGATSGTATEVSFTLEPLGVTPAPPIGPVVDALMAAIRR